MLIIQTGFFLLTLVGVGVILSTKNVVHAAYGLALVLVSLAGVYVLLKAELLAIVQLLLYAGGVVILLAFGIMLTNRLKGGKLLTTSRNQVIAAIVSLASFSGLVYLINRMPAGPGDFAGDEQLKETGILFLTDHLVAFELIAFVLLVALVGASYLAKMSNNE